MAWIPIAASVAGSIVGSMLNRQKGPAQQTTQTMDQNPWAPSIPYLDQILAQIQAQSQGGAPYENPNQMVAGLTPEQLQGAQSIMGMMGPDGAMRTIGQGQQAIEPFLSGQYMNVENNPYLQAATNAAIRPVTQNFQENVLPGIRSAFSTGTDAYDQSREGVAQGIASRGYLDAVSGISANMANRGYETGMQATQNAISQVPGMTTAAAAPGQAMWNIGALLQQQNQRYADAPGLFNQMQQQQLQFPLNAYTQIGSIGRAGGGTTTTTGAQGNPYLGALGGGILGNQLYNMWAGGQQPAATQAPAGNNFGGMPYAPNNDPWTM